MANSVFVTRTGDAIAAARMIGTSPSQAEPKFLGWGAGGHGTGAPYAAAKTDVAAFEEAAESRSPAPQASRPPTMPTTPTR